MVLEAAMQAQDAGDYGIAAALLIRDGNTELISFGRNAVLSSRDPLGHAEINAIRGIHFASPDRTEIPAELAERLGSAFRATKEARDADVSRGVLLHDDIAAVMAGLVARRAPG